MFFYTFLIAHIAEEVVTFPTEFTNEGEQPHLVTPSEFAEAFKSTPGVITRRIVIMRRILLIMYLAYADIIEVVSNPDRLIPPGLQPKDATGKSTYVISSL